MVGLVPAQKLVLVKLGALIEGHCCLELVNRQLAGQAHVEHVKKSLDCFTVRFCARVIQVDLVRFVALNVVTKSACADRVNKVS